MTSATRYLGVPRTHVHTLRHTSNEQHRSTSTRSLSCQMVEAKLGPDPEARCRAITSHTCMGNEQHMAAHRTWFQTSYVDSGVSTMPRISKIRGGRGDDAIPTETMLHAESTVSLMLTHRGSERLSVEWTRLSERSSVECVMLSGEDTVSCP